MVVASQHHHSLWRGTASQYYGSGWEVPARPLLLSVKASVLQKLSLEKSYITVLQCIPNFVGLQTLREILVFLYKGVTDVSLNLYKLTWSSVPSLLERNPQQRMGAGGCIAPLVQKKGPGPPSLPHTILLTSISFLRLLLFSSAFCVLLVIVAW